MIKKYLKIGNFERIALWVVDVDETSRGTN